ncbi:hypothetical protein [Clostridium algidicarnis]|uniref:hypothetical protein n=1 Tax=Clostridium algidicarnis TaxID=37659 RepID=UPI001C0BF4A8|nr:hypothetical protein [Clostridium algidicarnis]MBU3203966.1 hypothetical protein [Clostridium algidicarnis]MBU3212120.1 hypothetical protein [Clostridium algidicarnis]MBU3221375.1 hypothetical protein [Clostridium algidicarnis]
MKKIMTIVVLSLALLLGFSVTASADDGSSFGASNIKIYVDVGVVDGAKNGKFYHLTPGNASIYVDDVSNATDITLRKGKFSPSNIATVHVTGPGWYNLPGVKKDASDYSLLIVAYGNGGTASIHGSVHDHRAE